MDLFDELSRSIDRGRRARPDVPSGDLLYPLGGDEKPRTYDEFNAAGEPMPFICTRVASALPEHVIAGSVQRSCDVCGEAVWMSPCTCGVYDRITLKSIVCLECSGVLKARP